jgi:hypothetical protein
LWGFLSLFFFFFSIALSSSLTIHCQIPPVTVANRLPLSDDGRYTVALLPAPTATQMILHARLVYDDERTPVVAGDPQCASLVLPRLTPTEHSLNSKSEALCRAGWVCNGSIEVVNRNHSLLLRCQRHSPGSERILDVNLVVNVARQMGLSLDAKLVQEQLFSPEHPEKQQCLAQALTEALGSDTVGSSLHAHHAEQLILNLSDQAVSAVFRRAVQRCGCTNDLPGYTQLQRKLLSDAVHEHYSNLLEHARIQQLYRDEQLRPIFAVLQRIEDPYPKESEVDELVALLQRLSGLRNPSDDYSTLIEAFLRKHRLGSPPLAAHPERPLFDFARCRHFQDDLLKVKNLGAFCCLALFLIP